MDERVWVGSADDTPADWIGFESVEAFLASTVCPARIVIDDPAAALRETDFIQLFERFPLARIERVVGPWRAGIGRTDPTWPLVTTQGGDLWSSIARDDWSGCPLPLTADYEEIATAFAAQPVCLEGIGFSVQIADGDLRQMWEDLLHEAGAELVALPDSASVRLADDYHQPEHGAAVALCVRLTTAPWLFPPSANEVAFSISDSPWSVMQHIGQWLKRGDREAE